MDDVSAIEGRIADGHLAPALARGPLAGIAAPGRDGAPARRCVRQGKQQAAEHGDVLVALAALAAFGQVCVDHAERDALDLAFESVLEGSVVVDRQQT
jgi:hypothetical protein